MADNTTISLQSGGDVISTDDIAGVKVQRVKVQYGADGSATDVDGTHGLPTSRTPLASVTLANVASSATSVTLQASNSSRRSWSVFNDSTAALYVKFGATASATSFTVKVAAGAYYEMPLPAYTGVIDGIWASANGSARVTEGG